MVKKFCLFLDWMRCLALSVPQISKYHREGSVWNHTKMVMQNVPEGACQSVLVAAFWHDMGKMYTMKTKKDGSTSFYGHEKHSMFQYIEASRYQRGGWREFDDKVSWLIRNHMRIHRLSEMRAAKRKRLVDHKWFPELVLLMVADCRGRIPCCEDRLAENLGAILYE